MRRSGEGFSNGSNVLIASGLEPSSDFLMVDGSALGFWNRAGQNLSWNWSDL